MTKKNYSRLGRTGKVYANKFRTNSYLAAKVKRGKKKGGKRQ